VHPGLLAAAVGDRCDPGIFLQCGGGRAFAVFAKGDEQPGGADGPRSWERLEQGESRRALRPRRDSLLTGLDRLHGDPELVAKGRDAQSMGSENARIGEQGEGRLAGVEARCYDVRRAYRVVAEAGFQRGAPGEWCGFAGGPAAQEGIETGGSFGLEPWEPLRERVLQSAREAGGDPDCVVDDAAAGFDAVLARAPGGALGLARLERIAMGEEQCERECGVRGIVCGAAQGEGFALPRQCQRIAGQEEQQVILAPGRDAGAFLEVEAASNGLAVEPRAERVTPRRNGLGRVLEREALALCGARSWEPPILGGIRPVAAHTGRTGFG
jgi:hypothetical protein